MSLKVVLAGLTGMVVGFFIGDALSSSDERGMVGEVAGQGASSRGGRIERNIRSGGIQAHGGERGENESVDLGTLSGLSVPVENGNLVIVPTELLEKLSLGNKNQSLDGDLFSQEGELEAILQITDGEKKNLQRAWMRTREFRRDLETRNSVSERLPDGSVKITLPGLAQEVADIGNSFYEQLVVELGDNRASAFASLRQLDSAFQLPEEETIYTVEVESTGDGAWRYKMNEKGPAGNKVWVGNSIPESIRHLTEAADIPMKLEEE